MDSRNRELSLTSTITLIDAFILKGCVIPPGCQELERYKTATTTFFNKPFWYDNMDQDSFWSSSSLMWTSPTSYFNLTLFLILSTRQNSSTSRVRNDTVCPLSLTRFFPLKLQLQAPFNRTLHPFDSHILAPPWKMKLLVSLSFFKCTKTFAPETRQKENTWCDLVFLLW